MFKKWIGIALLVVSLVLGSGLAQAKTESVTFAWNQVISTDFAGWTLYMSTTQGGPYTEFSQIDYDPLATEYDAVQTINSPDGAEVIYYFVLTARDTNGNESSFSNEVNLTVDAISPGAPQSLTVTVVITP